MTELEIAQTEQIHAAKEYISLLESLVKKQDEIITLAAKEIDTYRTIVKLQDEKSEVYEATIESMTATIDRVLNTFKDHELKPISHPAPATM